MTFNARQAASDAMSDRKEPRQLSVRRASEIGMEATEWLWKEDTCNWLPLGEMTLLGGREGIGKSTMATP